MYEVYYEGWTEWEGTTCYGHYVFGTLESALKGLDTLYKAFQKGIRADRLHFHKGTKEAWDGHSATYTCSSDFEDYKLGVREVAIMDDSFLAEYK